MESFGLEAFSRGVFASGRETRSNRFFLGPQWCPTELTVVNTSYLHEQTEDESSVVCGVLDVVVFFVGGEAIKP